MKLTARVVAKVCAGEFFGDPSVLDTEFSFVTRDSREAAKGCLFAAIPGEKVNGHDFLCAVFESGALCAICEEKQTDAQIPYVLVKNTIVALTQLASYYRGLFDIPIIGITGSVGKTSAKEMVAAVLSQRFNTHKTGGNYNNELGVSLTLLDLRDEHEVAVIEMGISDFGEMTKLTEIVRPNIAVITSIGHSHLEYLKNLEGVLAAKTEIFVGMSKDAILIANGDDEKLATFDAPLAKIGYGLGEKCDVRAANIKAMGFDGMTCDIICSGAVMQARINAFGSHLVYAALAAAAVGASLKLTNDEIVSGISVYKPVGRRSNIAITDFCRVIDDCYNSNPDSVKSALKSLSLLDGRKVCILGDMLELGEDSPALHEMVGAVAADCTDLVLTCGNLAQFISSRSQNMVESVHFESKKALIDALREYICEGDNVLVKASRGMAFEEISEALMNL